MTSTRWNIILSLIRIFILLPIILLVRTEMYYCAVIIVVCMTIMCCIAQRAAEPDKYSIAARCTSISEQIFVLGLYTFLSMQNIIPKHLTILIVVRELLLIILSIITMIRYSTIPEATYSRRWNMFLQLVFVCIQLVNISASGVQFIESICRAMYWSIILCSIYAACEGIIRCYKIGKKQQRQMGLICKKSRGTG